MSKPFPLVDKDDNGIRPAGEPDACLYCKQKVGNPHLSNCVIVTKRVKVRFSFEVEVDVPYSSTEDSIHYWYNDSAICADDALDYIREYTQKNNGCSCSIFEAKYLETVDDTPRRELKPKAEDDL